MWSMAAPFLGRDARRVLLRGVLTCQRCSEVHRDWPRHSRTLLIESRQHKKLGLIFRMHRMPQRYDESDCNLNA